MVTGEGGVLQKTFLFPINRVFNPYFSNRYLFNDKNIYADNSRAESTIFSMENISFSKKLFSGQFYGQFFIETLRGPYETCVTCSFQMLSFAFQVVKVNRGRLPLRSVRRSCLAKRIQHNASCVTRSRDHSLSMTTQSLHPFIWCAFPARATQN